MNRRTTPSSPRALRPHVRRAFAVVAAVALGAGLGIAPADAIAPIRSTASTAPLSSAPRGGATFGIGPSDGGRIDGRSGLNFQASPGSRLTDRVAVVNLATTPVTLQVYAADAAAGSDGSIGYEPRRARQADAAAWIVPQLAGNGDLLTLGPRQTRVVPVDVRVPADAGPGDHVAGVIASLTSKVRNPKGQLIDFEQRVAVRTTLRISGAVRADLAVEDLSARYDGSVNPFGSGSAVVSYTVRNTGNVTLGARQRVRVSGLFGEDSARGVAYVPLLLPKASVRMRVTVPDVLPQVRLTARVTLYPLVVKGEAAPGLPASFDASTAFWGLPWALLVFVALLAAAATAAWLWRRRVKRRPSPAGGRHHRSGAKRAGEPAVRSDVVTGAAR